MENSVRETIIQFGGGVFLRGFADKFIDIMNKAGTYDGRIVVVQPIVTGPTELINARRGVYNLVLRGIANGEKVSEHTEIHSISRALDPYTDYAGYLSLAKNPDIRFIISNTTEAGIEYLGTERPDDAPPKSYPAKLTALLLERFKAGLDGFILLPCELIDDNGGELKRCVLKYAELWRLGDGFVKWLNEKNRFANTLVDRICTGYPKDDAGLLASFPDDRLLDTAEIFHLWVIEGNFEDELPLSRSGVNVIWTDDVGPYKRRKVRILNGAHTSMVPGALLYGLETVGECMRDKTVRAFLESCVFDEILPATGDTDGNRRFAGDVLERFENPFVSHRLSSIALNSVSKFRVRVLPTMLDYREKFGIDPRGLCFSLASLAAFYKKGEPSDLPRAAKLMKELSFHDILASEELWGAGITRFEATAAPYFDTIMNEPRSEWYKCAL